MQLTLRAEGALFELIDLLQGGSSCLDPSGPLNSHGKI